MSPATVPTATATIPLISTVTPEIPTQTAVIPTQSPIPNRQSPTAVVTQIEIVETITPSAPILQPQIPNTPTIIPTAIPTQTPIPTIWPTVAPYAESVIGQSVNGNDIMAYRIGTGARRIVLVGGIHGGFEWNASLLTYELLDYFQANPQVIPTDVALHIVPMMNPDGLEKVTGFVGRFTQADIIYDVVPGRFNANNVDLNRNWDCEWAAVANWSVFEVSGGTAPFSEAESAVMRDYLLTLQPHLVIFFHSKAPGVFIGNCEGDPDPRTVAFADTFAQASGYPFSREGFTAYRITGDATDYLSTVGLPALTIELQTSDSTEFKRNLAGVLAVME